MEVTIERIDDFGRGVAHIDGKVCFVENALPGETVEIEEIKSKKKYSEAKVTKYITKSKNRISSKCPYFDKCGGCVYFNIDFKKENAFKEEKIKSLIKKFTNLDESLVTSIKYSEEFNYRNKIILHGKNQKLGLYQKNSYDVIDIDYCHITSNKINEIIKTLHEINKNIHKAIIKTSNNEKYTMLEIKGEVTSIEKLSTLADVVILNKKLLTKEETIITEIGTKKYHEKITSFFQVNKTLTEKLYDEALQVAKKTNPNRVLDLYCGTGTIGIYISDYCKEIIGMDYNESNISDANKNKQLNSTQNISFICDKVENKIDTFSNIDLIIVDPPRAGLDKKTRDYLRKINPKNIVYISCDPITLVRDLNDLEEDYNIEKITPYNMFPKTYHVECVCLLSKKN